MSSSVPLLFAQTIREIDRISRAAPQRSSRACQCTFQWWWFYPARVELGRRFCKGLASFSGLSPRIAEVLGDHSTGVSSGLVGFQGLATTPPQKLAISPKVVGCGMMALVLQSYFPQSPFPQPKVRLKLRERPTTHGNMQPDMQTPETLHLLNERLLQVRSLSARLIAW